MSRKGFNYSMSIMVSLAVGIVLAFVLGMLVIGFSDLNTDIMTWPIMSIILDMGV